MRNLNESIFQDSENGHQKWEQELLSSNKLIRKIPNQEIVERLGVTSMLPRDIVSSIEQNTWYEYDGGKYIIEVPNPYFLPRKIDKAEMVLISDLDDTLFKTTEWHEKEYEYICKYWQEVGIEGGVDEAKAIYELSKIYVPHLAEAEKRYTPYLNFILLDQFRRRQLEQKMSSSQALEYLKFVQAKIQENIMTYGEGIISDYVSDTELLAKLIGENHPSDFMHLPLIRDLFDGDNDQENSVLRVVMTRGKIEGPLGQVYKVHQSGMAMLSSVDIVVYTNDRKIDALLYLMNIFPQLKSKNMLLYDDNPSETAPFCELIETRGANPFRMEIIQVRHNNSKRRDKEVKIRNCTGETRVKKPYASVGYALQSGESLPIEKWEDVDNPAETPATIFDHYDIDNRVMGHVV